MPSLAHAACIMPYCALPFSSAAPPAPVVVSRRLSDRRLLCPSPSRPRSEPPPCSPSQPHRHETHGLGASLSKGITEQQGCETRLSWSCRCQRERPPLCNPPKACLIRQRMRAGPPPPNHTTPGQTTQHAELTTYPSAWRCLAGRSLSPCPCSWPSSRRPWPRFRHRRSSWPAASPPPPRH